LQSKDYRMKYWNLGICHWKVLVKDWTWLESNVIVTRSTILVPTCEISKTVKLDFQKSSAITKAKVTRSKIWNEQKNQVKRNSHTKYKKPYSYGVERYRQSFQVLRQRDKWTDRWTDWSKTICPEFSIPEAWKVYRCS
jgi:hypothetical protein